LCFAAARIALENLRAVGFFGPAIDRIRRSNLRRRQAFAIRFALLALK